MPVQLKVMSFNLRVDYRGDGVNYFFDRFPRIMEVLEKEKPDIVGFQEVTDKMRAALRDCLPGYTVQGCGRDRNYHGESMLIAYRKDLVELIALENIWLSLTPEIPGSRYGGDQSGNTQLSTLLGVHAAADEVDEPLDAAVFLHQRADAGHDDVDILCGTDCCLYIGCVFLPVFALLVVGNTLTEHYVLLTIFVAKSLVDGVVLLGKLIGAMTLPRVAPSTVQTAHLVGVGTGN